MRRPALEWWGVASGHPTDASRWWSVYFPSGLPLPCLVAIILNRFPVRHVQSRLAAAVVTEAAIHARSHCVAEYVWRAATFCDATAAATGVEWPPPEAEQANQEAGAGVAAEEEEEARNDGGDGEPCEGGGHELPPPVALGGSPARDATVRDGPSGGDSGGKDGGPLVVARAGALLTALRAAGAPDEAAGTAASAAPAVEALRATYG
ncbi:hypothetical protein MMPV_004816 [Pyropia vietnamensis]